MADIGEFFEMPTLLCAHCLTGVGVGEWHKEEMCVTVRCITEGCKQFGIAYPWFPMVCEIEPDESAAGQT